MSEGRGVEIAGEAPGAGTDGTAALRPDPVIRRITRQDVAEAFAAGLRDFQAQPVYGLFFGGIYAVGGLVMLLATASWGLLYLVYPLAAGFALIGPFVAVGLYEVSRRRETGESITWGAILGVVFAQSRRELGWMAFVCVFLFILWMYQIRLLVALFFGFQPMAMNDFLSNLLGTPEGLLFLLIGHVDGAILSLVLFSLTVVSFPLLLDRDVDFITAMITSVRSVVTNPAPMVGWAAVVVVALIIGSLPAFLGLAVVLPVLGHTTWHLYRRLVAPLPG
ncbi:DUF2189 domain-containing protein [Alsobacter sp. R-9]